MSDLDVSSADIEEMLSSREVVPSVAEAPPVAESLVKSCPECGASKTKLGVPFLTQAQVNTHRAGVHGYRNPDAKQKKTPAKRAARPASAPAKPKIVSTRTTRRSTADLFGKLLGSASKVLMNVSPAGAMAMGFSAPAAGLAIDDLIAGTKADKVAQRVVSASDKWERVSSALGLPVMVTMVDLNPALFPILEEQMRDALGTVLVMSLPSLKKKRQQEREVTSALADLGELDPALAASPDPIGSLLSGFFAHHAQPEQPVAAE